LNVISLLIGAAACGSAFGQGAALNDDAWTWVSVDGSQCRDGSVAGISIRPRADSDDLLIFLGGGAMCIDEQTCAEADSRIPDGVLRQAGQFDIFANRQENPFVSWNQVFVPQCTGDLHSGMTRNAFVAGIEEPQQFVGHLNMALILEQIKARFSSPARVVFGGAGSGGQGAITNFPDVRRSFDLKTRMTLMIDSGPPVPSTETRGIRRAMELWGAAEALSSECDDACDDPENLYFDYMVWLADTYSGDLDIVMSAFTRDPVEAAALGMSQDEWEAYIAAVDSRLLPTAGLYHFYADRSGHAFTSSGMYSVPVGGGTFASWLSRVVAGDLVRLRGAH